jgi:hypothetical protein
VLVLQADLAELTGAMKKLFSVVAILALVGTALLSGCKKEEAPPAVPDVPAVDTNAPAPAK